MKNLNLKNLNKLAMASTLINKTIKNGCDNEIDILKNYVKVNFDKCNENYDKIVQFINEHHDMFYKITNYTSFTIDALNGLNKDAHGFKRFVYDDKFKIVLTYNKSMDNNGIAIDTDVMFCPTIENEFHSKGVVPIRRCSSINFDEGGIETWIENKKKIDNYIGYVDRLVEEFENMVVNVVTVMYNKIQEINNEVADAVKDTLKVKEVTITYGV